MLNSYLIIFMFCKNNNIFFAYLIFDLEILSAKIVKNNIALF